MTTRTVFNGDFHLSVKVDDFSAPWKQNKSVVLLQHGFGRTADIWTTWVPHLAAHFPIIRPTLRGLRQKPDSFSADTDITLDAYLDDLCRILDACGVDTVHYCGESFGGCIGIALAARHPERVKTLSLIATPVMQSDRWRETYAMGHGSWSAALRTLGVDAWLEETNRSSRFPPTVTEELVAWYNGQVKSSDKEVLVAMARLIETADMRPFLSDIRAPVLLMSPLGGAIMTDEQVAAYKTGVPDFTFVGFETRFHKIQLLHAEECARQVAYFCSLADGSALLAF